MARLIKCYKRSVDGCSKTATFKTLKGAKKFLVKWVGERNYGVGVFNNAVSSDGVISVEVTGATVEEIMESGKKFIPLCKVHTYEPDDDSGYCTVCGYCALDRELRSNL